MLKTVVIIVVVLIVAVAAVLAYATTKPDTFRVQRSASIKAPADKIFPLINDFHSWAAWSPYEKLDPELKRTYSGAPSGKGAVYAWEGNNKVGAGRMEIVDAPPPSKVAIKLDFLRPFEAHNTAEFTLAPAGDATTVTWAMDGQNLYVGKVMSIFVDMDDMIGKDFATGLANLKNLAEK
jgi:Polyketide cyclase / dehydrase and lipid transport